MTRTLSASIVMLFGAVFLAGGAAPAPAADRCVHILDRPGGKLLVNLCSSCRTVSVERRRPSNPAPTYRSYTLPPKSKAQMTMRGTDRTRITSDQPCEKPAEAADAETQRLGQCVLLSQTRDGKPALLNQCTPCRTAIIEMTGADGSTTLHKVTILGGTFETFDPKGALQARVRQEGACEK